MAIFKSSSTVSLGKHPKFDGVMFAPVVKREDGQGISVSFLEIAPGVEIPIHTHAEEADSIYVISGNGSAYVNSRWREIHPGDYILVPKGEEHGVKNSGEKPLSLFIVHCPPLF